MSRLRNLDLSFQRLGDSIQGAQSGVQVDIVKASWVDLPIETQMDAALVYYAHEIAKELARGRSLFRVRKKHPIRRDPTGRVISHDEAIVTITNVVTEKTHIDSLDNFCEVHGNFARYKQTPPLLLCARKHLEQVSLEGSFLYDTKRSRRFHNLWKEVRPAIKRLSESRPELIVGSSSNGQPTIEQEAMLATDIRIKRNHLDKMLKSTTGEVVHGPGVYQWSANPEAHECHSIWLESNRGRTPVFKMENDQLIRAYCNIQRDLVQLETLHLFDAIPQHTLARALSLQGLQLDCLRQNPFITGDGYVIMDSRKWKLQDCFNLIKANVVRYVPEGQKGVYKSAEERPWSQQYIVDKLKEITDEVYYDSEYLFGLPEQWMVARFPENSLWPEGVVVLEYKDEFAATQLCDPLGYSCILDNPIITRQEAQHEDLVKARIVHDNKEQWYRDFDQTLGI